MTLKICNFSKITPKKKCRAEPEKVSLKGLGAEYLHTKYHAHIAGDNLQSLYFMLTDAQLKLVQPLLLIDLSLLVTPNR